VKRLARGRQGEALAARYLEGLGLTIRDRNWRCQWGELDLVAEEGGALVFVEVRARSSQAYGRPEESVDARKLGRLVRSARAYLIDQAEFDRDWRVDVIAVDLRTGRLRHLRDVVQADSAFES
jgi:putative endonuclease